jgi:predicted thioesterase
MQTPPKVGTALEKQFTVEPAYVVDFSKDGIPPILATPWLIWFLESAAIDLMQPFLDPGELTVGVRVDVEHLAPTPGGEKVACTVRVVHADGPIVSFQLDARDRHGAIARGLHKRRVVNARRFAELVGRRST